MNNFFQLNDEKIIGFKKLSLADLGLNPKSTHQTHIGLRSDILTFMDASLEQETGILIYENTCQVLDVYFDRISRSDGRIECPKIRKGGRDVISMVTEIQDIVKRNINNYKNWYILWFGLKSTQAVFILFHDNSNTYDVFKNIGLDFSKRNCKITPNTSQFQKIADYTENIINSSSIDLQKDIEVEAQIPGKLITEKGIRKSDIIRAQKLFTDIGKRGEEFVAEYFDKLKCRKQIVNYNWVNKSSESGYPYDFRYQDLSDNIIYLDVKTTKFDFNQRIIYSNKEIEFARSVPNNCYNIYRVYNLSDNNADLRICKNCTSHFDLINSNILTFQDGLNKINTNIQSVNIAFEPTISTLAFDTEIKLKKSR